MSDIWSRATSNAAQTFVYADIGEGPLVVMWHGFPDTPRGWLPAAQKVSAAGYRVVVPWLRGYHPDTIVAGRGYDARTLAEDSIELLDALGEQDAVLVGHDWGASLVYGTASLAPERTRAIVPIAIPHPSLLPRDPSVLWGARHFVALKLPWAARSVRSGNFAYLDGLYRRWAPNWDGVDREQALADVKKCYEDPRSLDGALNYYRALSPVLPKELVKPPQVRGLLVCGTVDIVAPEYFERTADALAPGSETLIAPGAGHWPHREAEGLFVDKLVAFLGDLD